MAEPVRSSVSLCFVSSDAQLGGAELYLGSLLARLGPEWVGEVVVLGDGPLMGRLRADGLAPTVVPCSGRSDWPAAVLRLHRIFRRGSIRLVHANGPKAALLATLAAAGTPTRVLWHKHDSAREGRLGRWLARRCEVVVGVSSAALGSFAGAARVRSRVVPNGIPPYAIDRPQARAALLRELEAPEASRLVALVGRLHPGKGQLELLEIAPALQERVPEIRLILVGGADPHKPEYEHLVHAHTAAPFVHLLGFRPDAVTIIAGCDLLVIPSQPDRRSGWREGCGLVALEAMSVGTPVAGYAEPALVEVLDSCARLVETGDRAALADAIVELLDDSEASARLAGCGRRRVEAFRLDNAVERMKETYLDAAGRPAA